MSRVELGSISLEEILNRYPPKEEELKDHHGKPYYPQISRTEDGRLIYIVPGTAGNRVPSQKPATEIITPPAQDISPKPK